MAGIACGFMPLGGSGAREYERQAAMKTIDKIFHEIDTDHDGRIKVEYSSSTLTSILSERRFYGFSNWAFNNCENLSQRQLV